MPRTLSKTYSAIHQRIRRLWGKASKCEICHGKRGKRYEWANTDHKYTMDRRDWWELCSHCHRLFDRGRFGHSEAWNKGKHGVQKNLNTSGLVKGGWNKGKKSKEDVVCKCGNKFYPPKKTSVFCSKSCASKYR